MSRGSRAREATDRERGLELRGVLRMDPGALLERHAQAFGRRALAHRSVEVHVVTHEYAFTASRTVRRIDYLSDLLVGPRPAYLVILLPEPTPELQTDLAGSVVPG